MNQIDQRLRNGARWARHFYYLAVVCGVFVFPVTYLYITKDVAPTKIEKVPVADLDAALGALEVLGEGASTDFGLGEGGVCRVLGGEARVLIDCVPQ